MRFRVTCCESITSAAPTVWPHCDVPAPRGSTGTPSRAAIGERRARRRPRCAARRRRSARSGRSRRRCVAAARCASNSTSPRCLARSRRRAARVDRTLEPARRLRWCRSSAELHRGDFGLQSRVRVVQCDYTSPASGFDHAGDFVASHSSGALDTRVLTLDDHPSGRHFLQIPGPTNVPDRVLRAIDQPTIDHRGPEFARLGRNCSHGLKRDVPDLVAGHHLPGVGHRRLGSGAGQHALAGRSRADVRDRAFRDAVAARWPTSWGLSSTSFPATGATAPTPAASRAMLARRQGACDQGGAASCTTRPRPACTSRIRRVREAIDRARPSGAVDGRHDLVARLDRLPARRVGRRRDGRGLAEGPDAAAGPVVQRGQRQGARGVADRAAAALLLGLGRDASRRTSNGFFPVHAGDQPALRAARGDRRCCSKKACENVFARHERHAEATRRAVRAWGLEILCARSAPNTATR